MIDNEHLVSSLDKLQAAIGGWNSRNFPNKKPHQPCLGVGEEMVELLCAYGRLSHAHLKSEQGIRGTPEQHKAAKCDAVGDIVIYLNDYCNQNGLNMADCVIKAWNEVNQRDWVKYPKNGRSE